MRKLEPLIARFVDDVLRLVKEATADGLRTLLSEETGRPRTRPSDGETVASSRQSGGLPPRARRPLRGMARRSTIAGMTADLAPSAPGADITDPQRLLAITAPGPLDVAEAETAPDSPSDGPVSTVREAGGVSPVRLRANETLARVSSAGVVIRRAR